MHRYGSEGIKMHARATVNVARPVHEDWILTQSKKLVAVRLAEDAAALNRYAVLVQ